MTSWQLVETDGVLISAGRRIALPPRAAAVLACLIRAGGQIVSRDQLLAEVWPGLHVTKDLVREYIHDLRNALNDDAAAPSYIETLRGRGFRMIGNITLAARPAETEAPTPTQRQTVDQRATVAVLRPETLGDAPDLIPIAEGLAHDIIADLALHNDIAVIGRASSFAARPDGDMRAIAKGLGADYLLESSLRVLAGEARAIFNLIDGHSGRHVWAQKFVHDMANLVRLSDDIALSVVNALGGWQGELHRAEFRHLAQRDVASLNAYEHFIRACDLEMMVDAASLRRTLSHLEASIAMDPGFARAWVIQSIMLQWAYDVFEERDPDLLVRSAAAVEEAHRLEPRDPTTLGLIALKRARDGDHAGALAAIDLGAPNAAGDADGLMTLATAMAVVADDREGAARLLEDAIAVNPARPSWHRFVEARLCFFLGEHDRAALAAAAAPPQVTALCYQCLSLAMLEDVAGARAAHRDLIARYPRFDFEEYAAYFPISGAKAAVCYDTALARLRAMLG